MSESQHRPVNPMLGTQPRIGPIPAEQIVPWAVIAFVGFMVCRNLLHLDWIWTVLAVFWGCVSWWSLTGAKPWRFLSQFVSTPHWTRGQVRYRSVLFSLHAHGDRR